MRRDERQSLRRRDRRRNRNAGIAHIHRFGPERRSPQRHLHRTRDEQALDEDERLPSYRLHAGSTTEAGESEGTLDVVCPEGKEVEISASVCLITIPAESGLGPVFFRNVEVGGKEHITAELRIGHSGAAKQAFEYSTSGMLCGTHGGETDGTYTGDLTLKGSDVEGGQANLAVTEKLPSGEGAISWGFGTSVLKGSADSEGGSQVFTIDVSGNELPTTCDEVSIEAPVGGTGSATLETSSITYSDSTKEADHCRGVFGTSPLIKMNGCVYVLHAGTTLAEAPEGETEGTLDIVCPGEEQIEITAPGALIKFRHRKSSGRFS